MSVQGESWDAGAADRTVTVLKAVADPSRYRLLWALSRQELPVSGLAEMLGAHVAATSQHLAKLRAAGLVASRREGTRIYYRAVEGVRGLLEEASLVAGRSEAECAVRTGQADEAASIASVASVPQAPGTRSPRQPVVDL
ncbi:metalloregulator ArsR/SmtB family transcription factor [Streptomyces sp. MS1.AVA.4]|uniref:Metalloregulator ArsR/SmtB family transcription factor n=1 Tax=Streptomyces pratisoli TaxID=3139917 RepID=A0ACC6QJJ7_9ACTN